jgi:formate dehydrogenase subunit gamma
MSDASMARPLPPAGAAAAGDPRAAQRAQRRAAYWTQPILKIGKRERVLHWVMAAGGLLATITGIGWYWRSANWLLALFGGGVAARIIHVVAGTVFAVCAIWMIAVIWWREILVMRPYDFRWMKTMGGYLERQQDDEPHEHPPAGFFNAGQKSLGMMYLALAVLFLVTGVVIWWPELFPAWVARISLPLHALGFIGFAAGLVMHVYLSTAANPGTFGAIVHGRVTRLYAHSHHPVWYEELLAREAAERSGATVPDDEAGVPAGRP